MKVSIITCVLNNSKTIKDTIESVHSQIYIDKEHILIDGGSNDETLNIIEKNNNKNLNLFSSKDEGIYYAINKGINLCSGQIVGILHSDDFYNNEKVISDIVETFKKTNADLVYGDLEYVSKKSPHKIVRNWKAGKFNKFNLKKGWMPPHPTVFVKKDIFYKIGKYNTEYKISSDYDFLIRALSNESIKKQYIEKILVKMRVGGKSNKSIKNIINKSLEDFIIIKKNKIGGILTLLNKNYSKLHQFFY